MTSKEIKAELRRMHQAPEWAFFEEVANGTGMTKTRSADAMAFSLWPSRGFDIYGFEVKVSRQDWLNEKKNPQKADEGLAHCHFRILAVGSDKVVLDHNEIPKGWGLWIMQPSGRFKCAIKCERSEYVKPITPEFLAAVARKASEPPPLDDRIIAAKKEEYERGYKDGQQEASALLSRERFSFKRAEERIAEYDKMFGCDLVSTWNKPSPQEIATAIMMIKSGAITYKINEVKETLLSMYNAIKDIKPMEIRHAKEAETHL